MIFLVVVATLAALSTANPMAPISAIAKRLSIRQMPNCDGITIPERCTQALNDYTRMLQEIMNNPSPESARQIVDSLRTLLNTMCAVSVLLFF